MIIKADEYLDCKNEQQFKMSWIARNKGSEKDHFFCIESESTVLGFPDVLELTSGEYNTAVLYEFKFAKNGKIKFQPTQPAFYKKYKDLGVKVVAFNAVTGCLHTFCAEDVLCSDSLYKLNEKAEIDLSWVEHKWMTQ